VAESLALSLDSSDSIASSLEVRSLVFPFSLDVAEDPTIPAASTQQNVRHSPRSSRAPLHPPRQPHVPRRAATARMAFFSSEAVGRAVVADDQLGRGPLVGGPATFECVFLSSFSPTGIDLRRKQTLFAVHPPCALSSDWLSFSSRLHRRGKEVTSRCASLSFLSGRS
jgi:hypothetical protein